MNTRSDLIIKALALSGAMAAAMTLGACSRPKEVSTAKAVSEATTRPTKIAKAYVYEGGTCFVDSSNPNAVSNRIAATEKLPFALTGWVVVESTRRPVPPMVFAVLSSNSGAYFLEGRRVPRPDVANGDPSRELAGFEVAASFSNIPIGDYKLSVATGTEYVVNVCQTKLMVSISE